MNERIGPPMAINEIDMGTSEGKLLIAAIGTLMSCEGHTDKTPEKILEELIVKTEDFILGRR